MQLSVKCVFRIQNFKKLIFWHRAENEMIWNKAECFGLEYNFSFHDA